MYTNAEPTNRRERGSVGEEKGWEGAGGINLLPVRKAAHGSRTAQAGVMETAPAKKELMVSSMLYCFKNILPTMRPAIQDVEEANDVLTAIMAAFIKRG